MNAQDKDTIRRFAAGDQSLREEAVAAHRRAIPEDGVRGTPEQDFMAEIDHPAPDLLLRRRYRDRLLNFNLPHNARSPGQPRKNTMKAFQRLANGDMRVAAAFAITVAAIVVNYTLADNMGYDWKTGAIILPFATYFLGKHI